MSPPSPGAGRHDDDHALVRAVQHNCDVVDARHASDLSMCSFLLAMREFYRWEQGFAFGAPLARDAVGSWIAQREARWTRLEDAGAGLQALPLAGRHDTAPSLLAVFDVAAINDVLMPRGLLYGGGLVASDLPVFFLARLHARTTFQGLPVLVGGQELARGLVSSIAMLDRSEGDERQTIVVRRAALERACWERWDAYTLRPAAHPAMARVVRHHGLDDVRYEGDHDDTSRRDPDIDPTPAGDRFGEALSRWVDLELERVLLHEWAEHRVGERLDPAWREMRMALTSPRAPRMVRAVRDQLADLHHTLPALLDAGRAIGVHAWFAGHDGLRAAMAPQLDATYERWVGDGDDRALRACAASHARRFDDLADTILALHRELGADAGSRIEALVDAACGVRPASPGRTATAP